VHLRNHKNENKKLRLHDIQLIKIDTHTGV